MPGRFAVLVGLLVGALAFGLASGAAAQTFRCVAETAGQLSIQGVVQCECAWHRASELAGTPAGWRWSCGILKARMNQDVPASAIPRPYPLPPALLLEHPRLRRHGPSH